MLSTSISSYKSQAGFTLIELMIAAAIIGIIAMISMVSYQMQVRKAHMMTIYQEINNFRTPYQILMNEGVGVTDFSPSGLNMFATSKYCQFSVTAPNANGATSNAVTCTIHNLNYVQGESVTLDRAADGVWQCRASSGIAAYMPQACR